MKKYYTVQRTIQYAFPVGKYSGFPKTHIENGLEYTQPHTSCIGGFVECTNQADALHHINTLWKKMKQAYETDGWRSFQDSPDSADITFVSPQGVQNIYTNWILKFTK